MASQAVFFEGCKRRIWETSAGQFLYCYKLHYAVQTSRHFNEMLFNMERSHFLHRRLTIEQDEQSNERFKFKFFVLARKGVSVTYCNNYLSTPNSIKACVKTSMWKVFFPLMSLYLVKNVYWRILTVLLHRESVGSFKDWNILCRGLTRARKMPHFTPRMLPHTRWPGFNKYDTGMLM